MHCPPMSQHYPLFMPSHLPCDQYSERTQTVCSCSPTTWQHNRSSIYTVNTLRCWITFLQSGANHSLYKALPLLLNRERNSHMVTIKNKTAFTFQSSWRIAVPGRRSFSCCVQKKKKKMRTETNWASWRRGLLLCSSASLTESLLYVCPPASGVLLPNASNLKGSFKRTP